MYGDNSFRNNESDAVFGYVTENSMGLVNE